MGLKRLQPILKLWMGKMPGSQVWSPPRMSKAQRVFFCGVASRITRAQATSTIYTKIKMCSKLLNYFNANICTVKLKLVCQRALQRQMWRITTSWLAKLFPELQVCKYSFWAHPYFILIIMISETGVPCFFWTIVAACDHYLLTCVGDLVSYGC